MTLSRAVLSSFSFWLRREQQVRHHRAMFEQRIVLGDDSHFARLYGTVEAVDGDAAGSRFVESGDDAE